jgi:predicted secreted hydrolase
LRTDGAWIPVTGAAWLDREWSTSLLAAEQTGWDWFALMLDDGRDLMAFRLRRRDGSRDPFDHLVWIGPDGRSTVLSREAFRITPVAYWRDAEGVQWPVRWHFDIGGQRFSVTAAVEDQRMRTLIRYWEGLVWVSNAGGQRIGRGYMELTGYTAPEAAHGTSPSQENAPNDG